MSRFFSPKYLKAREARRRGAIDRDFFCRSCGYNLRGLEYGRNCPECGEAMTESHGLYDLLLSGSATDRQRWRIGLGLAAMCVAVALVNRVLFFVLAAPGVTPGVVASYIAFGALNSGAWVIAVWLVTPESLLERWPWLRRPRSAARLLALFWIVGYISLLMRYLAVVGPGADNWLLLGDNLGRFLGGIGVMFVAFILHHVAEEAERETEARRLNAAVWILWFPTLLAQVFPDKIEWYALVPLAIVLFFWGWLMALLALGIRGLYQHVKWAGIHSAESAGRSARVDGKRAEFDAQVEATIRPLPRLKGDIEPVPGEYPDPNERD